MKKIILLLVVVAVAGISVSCTKTCTCINPNNQVTEIEIDPLEECSARSSTQLGVCS